MSKLASKKIFELSLLILAAGSIYPLVYLRQNFEKTILTLFDISQAELASLYATLGIIFIVGYIPSGWLADRFSVKLLVIFSLLTTAATGIFYAQIPDSAFLLPIFLVWGFATVFTFWSAILKSVNLLADESEEGRYFGALDGGRGLVEAVLASLAIGIFSWVAGAGAHSFADTKAGFQAVVYMYCGAIILIAVALFFLMPNRKEQLARAAASVTAPVEESKQSVFSAFAQILKIREVWVMMLIIFCGYTLFWAHYYFSGYLNVNHGVGQVGAGVVTVIVLWMRPIGGFGGGFLADKYGRSRILSISMFVTAALLVTLALLPGGAPLGLIYVLIVAAGLLVYVIRGVYWSVLDETRVPPAVVGIAIGVISFFGYLPDLIIPWISNAIYNGFGDDVAGANDVFFIVSAGIGVIGALAAMYFSLLVKRRKTQDTLTAPASDPTAPAEESEPA
ncbi:MFS transporter [Leucobacter insecticola]|uniref:MFS transporter n=1 Tax=Leucobacter insecticola TaxID=2714934 RepID=A0A6G8FIH3_9MICO|nr:MFS transporter [Leucobacter insecticola]QIM16164.1 MFS transporter [Leucobacter insecticola]